MERSGPMVAVCLAPGDLRPEVDDLTGAVWADSRRSDLSASDAAALEYGLQAAEAWDGWVLVVAAGPPDVDAVLRPLIAHGAEPVRVEWGPHPAAPTTGSTGGSTNGPSPVPAADLAGDPSSLAQALAGAILSRGRPAMVLCGDRSSAHGGGAVPALLAHALGVEQALGLVSVSIPADGSLLVERRLDRGWRERLMVTGPAVLSVEAAGVRLRRAGLAAALAAESAPVPSEAPAVGGPAAHDLRFGAPRPFRPRTRPVAPPVGDAHTRLLALTGALSVREPARVIGPLGPAEAADELLSYLQRSGYTD